MGKLHVGADRVLKFEISSVQNEGPTSSQKVAARRLTGVWQELLDADAVDFGGTSGVVVVVVADGVLLAAALGETRRRQTATARATRFRRRTCRRHHYLRN